MNKFFMIAGALTLCGFVPPASGQETPRPISSIGRCISESSAQTIASRYPMVGFHLFCLNSDAQSVDAGSQVLINGFLAGSSDRDRERIQQMNCKNIPRNDHETAILSMLSTLSNQDTTANNSNLASCISSVRSGRGEAGFSCGLSNFAGQWVGFFRTDERQLGEGVNANEVRVFQNGSEIQSPTVIPTGQEKTYVVRGSSVRRGVGDEQFSAAISGFSADFPILSCSIIGFQETCGSETDRIALEKKTNRIVDIELLGTQQFGPQGGTLNATGEFLTKDIELQIRQKYKIPDSEAIVDIRPMSAIIDQSCPFYHPCGRINSGATRATINQNDGRISYSAWVGTASNDQVPWFRSKITVTVAFDVAPIEKSRLCVGTAGIYRK